MKNYVTALLFILLLVGTQIGISQEYIPMAVDNAQWIVGERDVDNDLPFIDGEFYEYLCNGDTLVNDLIYKKIYKRQLDPDIYYPPYVPIGEYGLHGLIRDDVENRKVYAKLFHETNAECPLNEDYLLYDFDVEVNDTVETCQILFPFVLRTIWNNIVIQGLTTNAYQEHYQGKTYYEGIGMVSGLFEDIDIFVKKNSGFFLIAHLYNYCREVPCGLIINTDEVTSTNQINFYPNPVKATLTLSIQSKANRFLLINTTNQIIEEIELTPFQGITRTIEGLKSGFYLGLLMKDNTVLETHKVVVVEQ